MSYIGKQPRKAALTASDIEDGIITAAKIEDGAVVAAEIASNAVTTAKINADAVTSAKIADNAVVTAAINADAVTGAKIADDAINSEHYTDGSIDTAHIAADQITEAKIADNAISEEHLDVTAITGHTAETTVNDSDLVLVHDASASALRKMTVANLTANAGVAGITSSANASAMTIDSDEIISKTSQPMCYVCVGNTTGVKVQVDSAGSHTVLFSHERFDVGGNYNTSNGNFTVPVAGYYACHASIRTFNTQQSQGYIQARIQGNNQSCNEVIHLIASGNSATCNNSFVGYFDANDTITCAVYNSADDDYQYGEGGNYNDTHMSIYKVG